MKIPFYQLLHSFHTHFTSIIPILLGIESKHITQTSSIIVEFYFPIIATREKKKKKEWIESKSCWIYDDLIVFSLVKGCIINVVLLKVMLLEFSRIFAACSPWQWSGWSVNTIHTNKFAFFDFNNYYNIVLSNCIKTQ